MLEQLADYRHIFLNDVPMMDVRAPIEFGQGAFPGVANLPLMNDSERQQVGTCYKHRGQQQAIALGHTLVSGETKRARIEAWAGFAKAHPEGALYCFRGGLRSQITQQWLQAEAGIAYPRVHGGYKALRSFLLQTTQGAARDCQFIVLGGLTGTGKTALIAQLAHGLDLEGHANHRGSSFGQRVGAQPVQIDFENRLAIDILKKRAAGVGLFVVEDEGRHVGRCAVPLELRLRLEEAPIVLVQEAFEGRVERILREYVREQCADFCAARGALPGFEAFSARLLESLDKLAKRLGGDRYRALHATMLAALVQQKAHGDVSGHRGWITALLRDYYDPMYAYQRQLRTARVEFEGDYGAVLAYLRSRATMAISRP
jgi:tRNA 2-selenouridine synthase